MCFALVAEKSEEARLAAVQEDGLTLRFMPDQTLASRLAAVQQNALALCFVQHQAWHLPDRPA